MSMDGTPIQNNGSHKASFSLSGVTGNKAQTLGTFLNRKVTALPGNKVSRVIIPIHDTPSITIRDTMGKSQTLKNLKERKIEKLDDSKTENRQRYQTLQLSLKYGQFTELSLEAASVKGGKEQELFATVNVNEELKSLKAKQLKTLTLPPPGGKGYTQKEADFLACKGMDWAAECFHESPNQLVDKYETWIQNAPNRTDNPAIQKRFSRSDSGYGGSSRSDHEIERPQSTQHAPDLFLSEERKARIEDWVKNIDPPAPGDLPMGGPDAVRSENKVPEDDKGPFASGSAESRPSQHADIFEEGDEDVLSQLFSEEDVQEQILDEAKGVGQEDADSGIGSGDDDYQEGVNDEGGQLTGADRKAFDDLDDMGDWETRSNLSEDSELFQAHTDGEGHDFTLEEARRKEGGQTSPRSEGAPGTVKTDGQKGPVSSFQTQVETEHKTPSDTTDWQIDLGDELSLQREQEEIRDDLSVESDTEFPDFMDFDDELFTEDQRPGSPMQAENFEARRPGIEEDDEDDFEEEGALENRESPNTEPDVQEISPSSAGGSDETEVLTSLEPGAGEADEEGVSQSRESDGGKDDGESGNSDHSGGGSQDKDKDQQEQDSQEQQESGEQTDDASLTGKASSATESKGTGEQVGRQPSTSGEDQVETDGQNTGLQAGTDEQETRGRVQAESETPVMESGQPPQKE